MSAVMGVNARMSGYAIRLEANKRHSDKLSADLDRAAEAALAQEIALKRAEERAARAEKEAADANGQLTEAQSARAQLKEQCATKDSELSKLREDMEARILELETQLATERSLVHGARNSSYVEHVKQFIKTRCFAMLVSKKAAPSFQMGYEQYSSSIGEGMAYEEARHSWGAYIASKLRALVGGATSREGPSSAVPHLPGPEPSEYEIPVEELLAETEGGAAEEESENDGPEGDQ